MKPFEKSEVRRNPDENSPRAEKRTKTERREASEDGESQENSQESGKGIDAGRRDKWKARWVSKPLR
jgi:hypothetical protein